MPAQMVTSGWPFTFLKKAHDILLYMDHFENHKQKYFSFIIVGIAVVLGTYLVNRTEALNAEQAIPFLGLSNGGRNCPPLFLLRARPFILERHPCFRTVEQPSPIAVPIETNETASTTENAPTSTATTTPEVATTTDASLHGDLTGQNSTEESATE